MNISLIVCTYMRPNAICNLLDSILIQTIVPKEILIVDGSTDSKTEDVLTDKQYSLPISYYRVDENLRGLTKQRNYGVSKVAVDSEIIAFLDDDIVLTKTYFEKISEAYLQKPACMGCGGYIIDDIEWRNVENDENISFNEYTFDGYVKKEVGRNILRKLFGLLPNTAPGWMPIFSHGRSVGDLPPNDKIYQVEFFMGGVASYRKQLFDHISFSEYFDGYGLYEDLDFTLRASKVGDLYVHTGAQLYHYHDPSGRPNQFKFGKMVVRNGWYVWRVKYINPSLEGRLKWNMITILLLLVRLVNVVTGPDRIKAFTETIGRVVGYCSLLFFAPKVKR